MTLGRVRSLVSTTAAGLMLALGGVLALPAVANASPQAGVVSTPQTPSFNAPPPASLSPIPTPSTIPASSATSGAASPDGHVVPFTEQGNCQSGWWCLFEDENYGGGWDYWTGSVYHLNYYTYPNNGDSEDNTMSSHWNNTYSSYVTAYYDQGLITKMFCVSPGYGTTWVGSTWNDQMSSFWVDSYCH